MSRAMIHHAGTGAWREVAGVKTAKLCVEQDQIGRRGRDRKIDEQSVSRTSLSGRVARAHQQWWAKRNDGPPFDPEQVKAEQNPAYRKMNAQFLTPIVPISRSGSPYSRH
jgi:hypothetical protein